MVKLQIKNKKNNKVKGYLIIDIVDKKFDLRLKNKIKGREDFLIELQELIERHFDLNIKVIKNKDAIDFVKEKL